VFLRQWHERRGNTDIHFGQWISEGKGDRKQRLVRFTPPPAAHPMLKRFTSTKFKEVQQFSITPKGEAVVLAIAMGEGGPSVDLETRVEWVARVGEDGILRCSITSRDEYKRKLFKEMIESFMCESTEGAIRLWIELMRRQLHHMGFTPALHLPSMSHVSESAGEESDGDYKGSNQGSDEKESDDEDDKTQSFVDAQEVLPVAERGAGASEEVAFLRSVIKSLEREVTNMELQLAKALARIAGLQRTVEDMVNERASTLPLLNQRLNALEERVQASSQPPPPLSLNIGARPPTCEAPEQDATEDRRLARRSMRKHRSLSRNIGNANGNVDGGADPPISEGSSKMTTKKCQQNPRRKLIWAGVATLVVLSISLALPLIAPRLLRRPLRFWPFTLPRYSSIK